MTLDYANMPTGIFNIPPHLRGEQYGGGVSKELESVCMGSNLIASICAELTAQKRR